MITFSVITPTLVRESLVRTCRSLDVQRYGQWQHLVMVDKPESALKTWEKRRLDQISDSRREIRYCPEAHRDFGNTCRSSAWDFVRGDYILYLDDDDYYVGDALSVLQERIAALPSRPVWGIFPVLRHGGLFFNVPPGHSRTTSQQFFHLPRVGSRELHYPLRGYCADGEFVDSLRESYSYTCIDPGQPLAVIDQSNFGAAVPLDRSSFEAAFSDYVTKYSIETEAISLEASYYLWEFLSASSVERVLDLGSGWSSFVFRLYKRLAAADLFICSTDESEHWLGTTARFLAMHDLDTSNLHLWPHIDEGPYDLVLYDMGRPWDQHEHLTRMLDLTRGVLLCDDMHYDSLRSALEACAASHGLGVRLLASETTDRFGRFLGLVERGG
jgi:glycosyltransferase involved in cell wall biosynthesis